MAPRRTPTEEEIRRNEAVFGLQGNRNPFIDHPEYAAQIYCYDGESYNNALQQVLAESDDPTAISTPPCWNRLQSVPQR